LRVRLVDGTSLAAAVVVNSIPQGTDEVVLAGNVSKVAHAIAAALCKKNVKVKNNSYICFMTVTCCFH
jgi:aldehyde decarbonylase